MPRLAIAQKVAADMTSASWIREMFEKGRRMKSEFGADDVQDFSLGNPNGAPPEEFFTALRAVAAERRPELHRYMPNVGFDETRAAVGGGHRCCGGGAHFGGGGWHESGHANHLRSR
jgi:aspartate aminotransferase